MTTLFCERVEEPVEFCDINILLNKINLIFVSLLGTGTGLNGCPSLRGTVEPQVRTTGQ